MEKVKFTEMQHGDQEDYDLLAKFEDKSEVPILTGIRGDQHINEVKLFNLINKLYSSNLLNLQKIEDKKTLNGKHVYQKLEWVNFQKPQKVFLKNALREKLSL